MPPAGDAAGRAEPDLEELMVGFEVFLPNMMTASLRYVSLGRGRYDYRDVLKAIKANES